MDESLLYCLGGCEFEHAQHIIIYCLNIIYNMLNIAFITANSLVEMTPVASRMSLHVCLCAIKVTLCISVKMTKKDTHETEYYTIKMTQKEMNA